MLLVFRLDLPLLPMLLLILIVMLVAGLLTGAGYATTVTSVYGGCAPAQHAFASADGTGALAGGFNSLFGKAQA